MKVENKAMLEWTKDVIDKVVSGEEVRTPEEIIKFLKKISNNIYHILLSEQTERVIEQSDN